jgi:coenzyme F420 hydrogenase subunit beta
MRLKVIDINDVAEAQLCCGCGACAAIEPDRFEMIDALDHGRRPRLRSAAGEYDAVGDAMRMCPGVMLKHERRGWSSGTIKELRDGWGPVLEVWEGFASDEAIRHSGSSGGVASALAVACLDVLHMHGVLHIRARHDAPILNETVLSTTREQILEATGSRYAPASPCDGLGRLENAPGPCVFIGKPCDVAATAKARRLRPSLDQKLGLTIAIFCAGTPTTRATMRLLEQLGVDDPTDVINLRYRGHGWPGRTTVTMRTERGIEQRSVSYAKAWGSVLTNDKQWRCHVCADHTGEFADIAVGDPWYRPVQINEPGRSLVLVRTERGRRILAAARASGHLTLERVEPPRLPQSQPGLLRSRAAVWGRLLACRALGVPTPRYEGLPILRFWLTRLSFNAKLRSVLGTVRRIARRRLGRRASIEPLPAGKLERAPVTAKASLRDGLASDGMKRAA